MKENRKLNPAIPILAILLIAMTVLCVILWNGKSKAEALAGEYAEQNKSLLEETHDYAEQNRSLMEDKSNAEAQANDFRELYEALREETDRAKQEADDKEARLKQYEEDMKTVVTSMMLEDVIIEKSANLIKNVWGNSISKIKDPETDKYTLDSSGYFYTDFNDALNALFDDESFGKTRQAIYSDRNSIIACIRELKDPPEEWREAYDDMMVFYDSYYAFSDLVLNPHYSYNEFTEYFKEYDNESIKCYDMMKLHLDLF